MDLGPVGKAEVSSSRPVFVLPSRMVIRRGLRTIRVTCPLVGRECPHPRPRPRVASDRLVLAFGQGASLLLSALTANEKKCTEIAGFRGWTERLAAWDFVPHGRRLNWNTP